MNARRLCWLLPGLLLGLSLLVGCPGPLPMDNPGGTPGINPNSGDEGPRPNQRVPKAGPGTYLFCFWNVENLFDDQDDGRQTRGDDAYDGWFARDKESREQKYKNICDVLIALNGGKGPDILALAECESDRAVEMLQQALNRRLDPKLHYINRLYEDPNGGRHIACAVLTRLPVVKDRTTLLGRRLRILESRVMANDAPLVLIASHWSSRLSDKTGDSRAKYADVIQGRFRAMYKSNPAVDLLVCGDFNDDPNEPSVVEHLRGTGDRAAVLRGGEPPMLYNLMASLAEQGELTHYYRKNHVFDQICVSPGMLDNEGWSIEEGSATVVKEMANRNGRPNRFGSKSDKRQMRSKGASDHFPVTVRLRVR